MLHTGHRVQASYTSVILENVLSLVLQIFLNLEVFKSNTIPDWLNHMVQPFRSYLIFKFSEIWRIRQRMFMKTVDICGPGPYGCKATALHHDQEHQYLFEHEVMKCVLIHGCCFANLERYKWRATREKGLSDVCVKCHFRSDCTVRTA